MLWRFREKRDTKVTRDAFKNRWFLELGMAKLHCNLFLRANCFKRVKNQSTRHRTALCSALSHTHLSPEFVVTFLVAALSQVFSLLLSWELDRIVLEITEITKSPVSTAGTFWRNSGAKFTRAQHSCVCPRSEKINTQPIFPSTCSLTHRIITEWCTSH